MHCRRARSDPARDATHAEAVLAARRAGELATARDSFLRVLALDPDSADAAKALREIDLAVMAKSQNDRAARVRVTDDIIANAKARATESYDLEQRLEIMRAGDFNAGLREIRVGDETRRASVAPAYRRRVDERSARRARVSGKCAGLYEPAARSGRWAREGHCACKRCERRS